MKARAVLKRSIGVPVLVALFALLGTLGAQAQDPALVESGSFLIRPSNAALDVFCGIDFTNADPYMWVDETDVPCPDLATPEIRDVQITGNVAWTTVAVGDGTELHVYLKKDGVWERFPFVSEPDGYTLYMLEQENAFVQQHNPGAAPAAPRSDRYTVDTEAEFLNMLATENAYEALHNATVIGAPAAPSASADVSSSRYTIDADEEFLNMLETENAYEERFNPGASPSIASPSVSVDLRGENYWNELLAEQEGSEVVTPSSASVSPDSAAFSIDVLEPEIHVLNGGEAKTLNDLLAEMFGSALPGQIAAGEDLTREIE
jgi:hypothetical protein